jgi:hypothetical protein
MLCAGGAVMSIDPSLQFMFAVRGRKHGLYPDLMEEELFAIGRVTVGFALLEHTLLVDSISMLRRLKIKDIPPDVLTVSFDRRLSAWVKCAKRARKGVYLKKCLAIADKIKKLQRTRNRITHGLWTWDYAAPGKSTAATFKPKFEFTESFDYKRLIKVSDEIANINFQISYPRGKKQAWHAVARSVAETGFSMSRDFAMEMKGEKLPPSLQRRKEAVVPSISKPWENPENRKKLSSLAEDSASSRLKPTPHPRSSEG